MLLTCVLQQLFIPAISASEELPPVCTQSSLCPEGCQQQQQQQQLLLLLNCHQHCCAGSYKLHLVQVLMTD
jgi:hypothetical protein